MSKIYLSVNTDTCCIVFYHSSLKAIAELLKTAHSKGFSLNDSRTLAVLMSLIDAENNDVKIKGVPPHNYDYSVILINDLVYLFKPYRSWQDTMTISQFYDKYCKSVSVIPKQNQIVTFNYNSGSNPGMKTVKVDNAGPGHIYGYDLSVPNWKFDGYRHYKTENIIGNVEVVS